MKRILVTGATGNIGLEVVHFLSELETEAEIIAAVRNVSKAKFGLNQYPNLLFRQFDFEDERTYVEAFNQVDTLFLLRPPHISDVEKYFRPLLLSAKQCGIEKVVFLSVQGAEKSKVIPHNKIERLIQELQFEYIFVRPSYFMQNLTTTLLPEIVKHKTITLPSGKAKFNWIDVKIIGEACAHLITAFDTYRNQTFDITGFENKSFQDVTKVMSDTLQKQIRYIAINPIRFYFNKKKEGLSSGFAVAMTLLHFLPRLQPEPIISDNYLKLTGKSPTTLQEFIDREQELFTTSQNI